MPFIPVRKISYPLGFILVFSVCYFLLQIVLGFYIRQLGVPAEFIFEMIRDYELTIQVLSLLLVLFLFEAAYPLRLSWPTKLWHSIESFLFSPNPDLHPRRLHPESPWTFLISGLTRGLVLAALSVTFFRFCGWITVEQSDFNVGALWLMLPYFLTQSVMFIAWFVLVGKLRSRVVSFLQHDELRRDRPGSRKRYPFLIRIVYLVFESQLLFRIFDAGEVWPDRLLTALFCLLLSATAFFLEEEFQSASGWSAHYFWKRRILKLGAVAGFWSGIFYVFGWRSGIPWKVSLFSSTEGPALAANSQVLLLGLWVLLSNTVLQLEEMRSSWALKLTYRAWRLQRHHLTLRVLSIKHGFRQLLRQRAQQQP